ncbi:hypothetical protein K439DRAFT_1659727 [Ramaria rubella]|nr:hypothetical protein K439DRAFT_1659727 [Ramaria rubella]
MDDPWGSNAWSTTGSESSGDNAKKLLGVPKWNTFERDADENTIDVGEPSWSATAESGWGVGTNLWNAEPTLDAWKPSDEVEERTGLEGEDAIDSEEQLEDKDLTPNTTLPTPPLSPLPVSSSPSTTPPAVETSPLTPPRPLLSPSTPDPFGSFESAEVSNEVSHHSAPWTKTSLFSSEPPHEPWGGAWGGEDEEQDRDQDRDQDQEEDKGVPLVDEWELAQHAKRKRDRKVPPELLNALVNQWDEFAKGVYPKLSSDHDDSQGWRKGLDSVDGLAELVESLIPTVTFPPPLPFSKTAVAKSVKETLRLTRSFSLTQSSPMAHLYASKGSTDWERSVKAQNTAANDEWGWDLKHEPESSSEPADSIKDKKVGGLLSFWSRRASFTPSMPTVDSPAPTKSPTLTPKPSSPATPSRLSLDVPISPPVPLVSATTPATLASTAVNTDLGASEVSSTQASAVSRFLNRFSRKPPATATSASLERERHSSLSLSADDFTFLSDMGPSSSEGSLLSPRDSDSAGSLEAMLSLPAKGQRYSSASSSKLPLPLAPPPPSSSQSNKHKPSNSQSSDADGKLAEIQFMDLLLDNMGGTSSGSGYAPVSFDLIESPVESKTRLPAPRQAAPLSPKHSLPAYPAGVHPVTSQMGDVQGPTQTTGLLPPPLPSPIPTSASRSSSSPKRSHDLTAFAFPPHPPAKPSRPPSTIFDRGDNPLPPTPQRDLDDFSDFLSASPASPDMPPHSHLLSQSGPFYRAPITGNFPVSSSLATSSGNTVDFDEFDDFISTSVRTPSPPKVPIKVPRAANQDSTAALVEKAAARPGRWPTPLSPPRKPLAPPPLAPPPNTYFNKPSIQQPPRDLLSNDDYSTETVPISETSSMSNQTSLLTSPLFTAPPPPTAPTHPPPTLFPVPLSPSSASRASTPTLNSAQLKPGTFGLSAQDLSFFEGL